MPKFKEIKRDLRKNSTPEEQQLWLLLKSRNFYNYKFRRQVLIDNYIVDFCCFEKRLIIELDGGHHRKTKTQDFERDHYLKQQGFKVLRFWNSEITNNINTVKEQIRSSLLTPSSVRSGDRTSSPARGEEKRNINGRS